MSLASILLYVHVIGALAYSASVLMSLLGLLVLRRTQRVEQARPILGLLELTGPLSGISLLLIAGAGLYLTAAVWGWRTAWILVAMGSVVLLLLPAGAIMGIRRHITATVARQMPDGPLPESLQQRIHDPLLGSATVMLGTVLLGIVFLMAVHPALAGSLITMGVSVVLGAALSLPLWRSQRQPAGWRSTHQRSENVTRG